MVLGNGACNASVTMMLAGELIKETHKAMLGHK